MEVHKLQNFVEIYFRSVTTPESGDLFTVFADIITMIRKSLLNRQKQ